AAMAEKYRDGRVAPAEGPGRLAEVAAKTVSDYRSSMDRYALEGGAAAVFRLVDAANEYIAETEPWALARDPGNAARLSQVLYDVGESVRIAGILLLPIMPKSAADVVRRTGEATDVRDLRLDNAAWRNHGERTIHKGDALWPRIEPERPPKDADGPPRKNTDKHGSRTGRPDLSASADASADRQGGRADRSTRVTEPTNTPAAAPTTAPTPAAPAPAPAAPAAAATDNRISIEDFMKIDLRVAKVLAAERVPNSKKLMKLSIDVGTEQRTLVAGIAEAYEAEQLVGKTIG